MSRILVAYYSRTGNTRRVAQALAKAFGADLEEIQDARPRKGFLGWFRSGREAWRKLPGEVVPAARDPSDYDLVVLGSPVWAGHVSSPMRGYLEDQIGKFSRIALFVTEGGTGGVKAFSEMAGLAGGSPIATLELTERDLGTGLEAKLGEFTRQVELETRADKLDAIAN